MKKYLIIVSRTPRIAENAFGIMCTRYKVLLRTLELDVPNAMQVVCACVTLHNFLSMKKDTIYCPSGFIDVEDWAGNTTPGSWRSQINYSVPNTLAKAQRERPSARQAKLVRDTCIKRIFF